MQKHEAFADSHHATGVRHTLYTFYLSIYMFVLAIPWLVRAPTVMVDDEKNVTSLSYHRIKGWSWQRDCAL